MDRDGATGAITPSAGPPAHSSVTAKKKKSLATRQSDVRQREDRSDLCKLPPGKGNKPLQQPPAFDDHDDTRYWDYTVRMITKGDLGHTCRSCKRPFVSLREEIAVRRGGRIELRYHAQGCFSYQADPRTQPGSSADTGKFAARLKGTVAPKDMYRKMRTSSHW